MLNVIILSVVMLSVMAPVCFKAYGKGFKLNCRSNLFHASNHHKATLILAKFNAKISAKMFVVKDAILPALATLVDATKIGSSHRDRTRARTLCCFDIFFPHLNMQKNC
jgi:hypothetical protein